MTDGRGAVARRPALVPIRALSALAAAGALVTIPPVAGLGCAGAPWYLGEPLDGKPSIPPTSRTQTVADHRRRLDEARQRKEKVIELAALAALEQRGALNDADTKRFSELLKERARDWVVLRRPIPLAADLRHMVALEPGRAPALAAALRSAQRAAGDRWLALGENGRAEEEYRRAERLGAPDMLFRFRAAWGATPADLDRPVLERALTVLPERALGPFTAAYLDVSKAEDAEMAPPVLRRAWLAARVYGPVALRLRLEGLPGAADFTAPSIIETPPPAVSPPDATLLEPGPEDRLYGGATLARALLPLPRFYPNLSAPGLRSREWAERLLAEDPTSPDSLEFAALVDARAERYDGAERKLIDVVFYSPDRAQAYARAALVWEAAGQGRRACAAWDRAARSGAADDPRWCALIECLGHNPGAGDAAAVVAHVRDRAPGLACAGGGAAPVDPVPADGGTMTPPGGGPTPTVVPAAPATVSADVPRNSAASP